MEQSGYIGMGYEKSHSIPMDITSYQLILMVRWFFHRTYSFLQKGGIPMEDYDKIAPSHLHQPPAPRRRGRKWFLIGGLAFAFMLALGVGVLLGTSTGTTQASALTAVSTSSSQSPAVTQGGVSSSQSLTFAQRGANNAQPMAGGQGQCETLTVSSVSGNTIVAKSSNGSSVTIHTTASTSFRQAGKTVTASAITIGARIHVMGTHNSDGSITATSIDVG